MKQHSGTGTTTTLQDDHVTTFGQLKKLCWLLQLFYLLIWELVGFILSFRQINFGDSVFSIQAFTGFVQPDDGRFQQAGSAFKGGSVMYWNNPLVEDRWTSQLRIPRPLKH